MGIASGQHHMREHIQDQRWENARWLIDEVGMHPELVARRLGISLDALEKLLERRKEAAS
jgi:DNA-binding transcriptional regulator LsrR (DeoR family)